MSEGRGCLLILLPPRSFSSSAPSRPQAPSQASSSPAPPE